MYPYPYQKLHVLLLGLQFGNKHKIYSVNMMQEWCFEPWLPIFLSKNMAKRKQKSGTSTLTSLPWTANTLQGWVPWRDESLFPPLFMKFRAGRLGLRWSPTNFPGCCPIRAGCQAGARNHNRSRLRSWELFDGNRLVCKKVHALLVSVTSKSQILNRDAFPCPPNPTQISAEFVMCVMNWVAAERRWILTRYQGSRSYMNELWNSDANLHSVIRNDNLCIFKNRLKRAQRN